MTQIGSSDEFKKNLEQDQTNESTPSNLKLEKTISSDADFNTLWRRSSQGLGLGLILA